MNFSGNQRKMYLLALVLLIVAIALACTWSLWQKPADSAASPASTPEPTAEAEPSTLPELEPEATPQETDSADDSVSKASTIVYYQDNYGYLVPVMCSVPMEDGIAKATLNMMIQSASNDMQAARLGLRTVLPENTTIDLDISNGLARIDLSKEVLNMADAAAETNMINAIVQFNPFR